MLALIEVFQVPCLPIQASLAAPDGLVLADAAAATIARAPPTAAAAGLARSESCSTTASAAAAPSSGRRHQALNLNLLPGRSALAATTAWRANPAYSGVLTSGVLACSSPGAASQPDTPGFAGAAAPDSFRTLTKPSATATAAAVAADVPDMGAIFRASRAPKLAGGDASPTPSAASPSPEPIAAEVAAGSLHRAWQRATRCEEVRVLAEPLTHRAALAGEEAPWLGAAQRAGDAPALPAPPMLQHAELTQGAPRGFESQASATRTAPPGQAPPLQAAQSEASSALEAALAQFPMLGSACGQESETSVSQRAAAPAQAPVLLAAPGGMESQASAMADSVPDLAPLPLQHHEQAPPAHGALIANVPAASDGLLGLRERGLHCTELAITAPSAPDSEVRRSPGAIGAGSGFVSLALMPAAGSPELARDAPLSPQPLSRCPREPCPGAQEDAAAVSHSSVAPQSVPHVVCLSAEEPQAPCSAPDEQPTSAAAVPIRGNPWLRAALGALQGGAKPCRLPASVAASSKGVAGTASSCWQEPREPLETPLGEEAAEAGQPAGHRAGLGAHLSAGLAGLRQLPHSSRRGTSAGGALAGQVPAGEGVGAPAAEADGKGQPGSGLGLRPPADAQLGAVRTAAWLRSAVARARRRARAQADTLQPPQGEATAEPAAAGLLGSEVPGMLPVPGSCRGASVPAAAPGQRMWSRLGGRRQPPSCPTPASTDAVPVPPA